MTTTLSLSEKAKEISSYSTVYVDTNIFKEYLLLQRRALLQSVSADERLMMDLDTILRQIELIVAPNKISLTVSDSLGYNKSASIIVGGMPIDNLTLLEILKKCIAMIKRNAEERRKAYLQIVRDTEKRYNLGNQKKRGRFNRQGI